MKESKRKIDLYLIAGQSNAGGYTKVSDRAAIYVWAPELETGFPNVHYAGNSRGDVPKFTHYIDRKIPWQMAKLGFGVFDEDHFGPEAGMAKALSARYSPKTGVHAGIIKFTHGGTSLLDSCANGNRYGNWVSPSYAADLEVEWREELPTGGLYRGFLKEVREQIEALKAYREFDAVELKGLYWMQGEGNRLFPSEYRKAFRFWVSDVRRDLSALMLELACGEGDCGASELPVYVGVISSTFGLDDSIAEENLNRPFIEMQLGLPNVIPNCYTVDNSGFAMARWDAETDSRVVLGTDSCHWNQTDALAIGENVGKAMLLRSSI